ncbi:MAG: hypothetical protein H0U65_04320 [Rubrobacter sp.]|nr:hypothetical protein [Rubrobacter sp.]
MGEERKVAVGFDWAGSEDLTALSVEELKAHLEKFSEEEREVSYKRRVLQGRIDLIRAEIVRRGGDLFASPEELARVLLGESAYDNPEGAGGSPGDSPGESPGGRGGS